MKRLLLVFALVLPLCVAVLAVPYTLKIDGNSTSLEGVLEEGELYVLLLPFLQALGGGARPVKLDYTAATIELTRGDGSKTVKVSFKIINQKPYVAAVQAAAGLGFSANLNGTTLTLSSRPATPETTSTPAPLRLYPQGFDAASFEAVARTLIDEMNSTSSSSAVLQAVLNGSGLPVFGTPTRPADGDLLEVYQALHHPFATVIELFTLRVGFQYRLFTPLAAYFSGLSERGIAGPGLGAAKVPGLVGGLFGGEPSRSQVVLALVGAIGRERARRNITYSNVRDPFWGDDALDPVQLRLLSAVLETGAGPEHGALVRGAQTPGRQGEPAKKPVSSRLYTVRSAHHATHRAAGSDDPLAPQGITDFFNKVAEKSVKAIVKEVYPDAAAWLDNAVQDALGIPIALPISPELLEGVLKGDLEGVKSAWGGLLQTASVETVKDGARAMFCGSIVLYGYQSTIKANPDLIHHRTKGDEAGKSLSTLQATLTYAGDYRDRVFKTSVRYASRLALKKPLTTVGELLERLGCELPNDDPKTGENPVKGKNVEWELTGDLPDQINGGKPDFADPTTDGDGLAFANFRAIDEKTPKAFRSVLNEKTGNVFVRFSNLIPKKWSTVQRAAQFGQGTSEDTSDQGSAGSSTQRLHVKFYDLPNLTLKYHSTMTGTSSDTNFGFQLEASVPLKANWNGDPNDPRSRFISYEGIGNLHYLARNFTSKCGTKIQGVTDGKLEVKVVSEHFDDPQITVVLNPGLSMNSLKPIESFVVGNCPFPGGGSAGLWFGAFLGAYGTDSNKRIGALPDKSFSGLIVRDPKQNTNNLFDKTVTAQAVVFGANVTDTSEIRLEVTR